MTSDHVVHVVVLAQVELQQVNLNLTVFDKHAVFDNLEDREELVAAFPRHLSLPFAIYLCIDTSEKLPRASMKTFYPYLRGISISSL